MVLFPPPFYFVFYISNLLSYIQNNLSYELARPIMGTIFLVSERSERDTLRSVQSRIAYIYIAYYTSKSGIWRDISRVASYFHEPKASANTAYE